MTKTPGSFSNRRRTGVLTQSPTCSAICATEKCCSIEPRDGTLKDGLGGLVHFGLNYYA